MNASTIAVSHSLQAFAEGIDNALTDITGEHIGFSLIVWTEGRAQYVSNSSRADVIEMMKELLDRRQSGMSDVPAHEVRG